MIEQIDLDALRIAVRGHRRWQQVRLADQCGVSTEALHLFATGTALISVEATRKLAELILPGARP